MGEDESPTKEVVEEFTVDEDTEAVQFTSISLIGKSETEQYTEEGTYRLIRMDEQED